MNGQKAQKDFNKSKIIFIVGNGGNLAVADHGSVDITRLSDKLAICPAVEYWPHLLLGTVALIYFYNWQMPTLKQYQKKS